MRISALTLLAVLLPSSAWADCVYTGAKRLYLECIYNEALTNTQALLSQAAELVGLDTRLGDVEGDVGGLQAALAGTQGDVASVQGEVSLLSGALANVEADLSGTQAALSATQDDVSALSTALSLLEGAITSLTGSLTALDAEVGGLSSDLTDLSATVGDLEAGELGQLSLDGVNVLDMFPFYRMTANQALNGTANTITGWEINSGAGVTVTHLFTVNNNVVWGSRSAEEQALLTAMGRAGTQHITSPFRVYRMSWTTQGSWTMYQRIAKLPSYTTAAFTKLESGQISGQWATGATSTWSLTGTHAAPSASGYDHIHPISASPSGSILVAMPAAVAGWVDLSRPINWGWFPYVPLSTVDQ